MVAEGFRRLGYAVENRGRYVPETAGHISLSKNGERTLVECQEWRATQVGLGPVRELYRTMPFEHADGALLVTSGSFTPEAELFARDKPIGLIDGQALLELVEKAQHSRDGQPAHSPRCPVCSRSMEHRKGAAPVRSAMCTGVAPIRAVWERGVSQRRAYRMHRPKQRALRCCFKDH